MRAQLETIQSKVHNELQCCARIMTSCLPFCDQDTPQIASKLMHWCMQNGNYTAQALPDSLLSNIARSTIANSFKVFPRTDVPYGRYFRAINDSCSVIVAPNVTAVGQCSKTSIYGYGDTGKDGHGDACCFDTTDYTVCYIPPQYRQKTMPSQ